MRHTTELTEKDKETDDEKENVIEQDFKWGK